MTAHGTFARLWHAAREYAGHWMVAGVILAATGAAPEHWFADLLHDVHLPVEGLHLWGAGFDLRLILIGAGVLMIAGDIIWQRTRLPGPACIIRSRAVTAGGDIAATRSAVDRGAAVHQPER
jgi:hypothetical protein